MRKWWWNVCAYLLHAGVIEREMEGERDGERERERRLQDYGCFPSCSHPCLFIIPVFMLVKHFVTLFLKYYYYSIIIILL